MGKVRSSGRRAGPQGQADRREAREAVELSAPRPAVRALVHRPRYRRRDPRRPAVQIGRAPRSTSRSACPIGSRTPGSTISCSSRCSTANTSVRTTSCASRTTSAAPVEPAIARRPEGERAIILRCRCTSTPISAGIPTTRARWRCSSGGPMSKSSASPRTWKPTVNERAVSRTTSSSRDALTSRWPRAPMRR